MKIQVFVILIFITLHSFGQSLKKELQDVNTYDEARALVEKNPSWQLAMIQLNSSIDTSALQKIFYTKKTGDIFMIGKYNYKVLFDTSSVYSRVNYIFLDGTKLSRKQIDSSRDLIIAAYKKGISFDSLSTKFNMDGNQNFGDTNWFTEGMMIKEFSDEVKKHKLFDVFKVDVVDNNWFYVVKKTFETTAFKQMAIIRIQTTGSN